MGSGSERMIEEQQYRNDVKNAAKMGITIDELQQCDYEYEEDTSHDGTVYGIYLKFNRDNSPKEITDKIGLDDLGRFELDNDGDDEDFDDGEN